MQKVWICSTHTLICLETEYCTVLFSSSFDYEQSNAGWLIVCEEEEGGGGGGGAPHRCEDEAGGSLLPEATGGCVLAGPDTSQRAICLSRDLGGGFIGKHGDLKLVIGDTLKVVESKSN